MILAHDMKCSLHHYYSIGLNCIGDAGAEYIAQALRENKSESVKEI